MSLEICCWLYSLKSLKGLFTCQSLMLPAMFQWDHCWELVFVKADREFLWGNFGSSSAKVGGGGQCIWMLSRYNLNGPFFHKNDILKHEDTCTWKSEISIKILYTFFISCMLHGPFKFVIPENLFRWNFHTTMNSCNKKMYRIGYWINYDNELKCETWLIKYKTVFNMKFRLKQQIFILK
jgi:hypothetical protein